MSYVNSVLGQDENIYYEARVSLLPYFFRFVFGTALIGFALFSVLTPSTEKIGTMPAGTVIGLIALVVGLLVLIQPIIAKETTELVITDRRIIAKFGLIRRYTIELNLSKVESIRVSQSILARLLNYGDLEIVGTGGTREPIPKISNPLLFRRKFDEILNRQ